MNLGENNNLFRESFRGFNKDDVAEYIAKLSKDYTANEEKYKEHIAKLSAELKVKTDEISRLESELENKAMPADAVSEIEQKYKDQISGLVNDLNEKDEIISALQARLASASDTSTAEEPAKNQDDENEAAKYKAQIEAEAINQMSLQLAESESERMYIFNLLKKFIFALDIESAKGKDIENIAYISDIAPKSAIAGEIDSELGELLRLKDEAARLEAENAELAEMLNEKETAMSNEEQMYKSVMTKLGETVYSANKLADDTVAEAKVEAGDIIDRAKIEADAIIEKASAKKSVIEEEDRRRVWEIKEKYAFIKKEHEKMIQKYKEISEIYALRLSEIENTVNVIYDSVNVDNFG